MYAVIKTGGKQYKVASGDLLRVEKLEGEAGQTVAFDQVLMLDDAGNVTIGAPLVAGASVTAEIIAQARDPKILVFKKKRRHKYRRKNGHRQLQTVLRVTGIKAA
ncbi:MAG: 50S ribosomal protein L21 [Alphaproteobacteria bacterium]|nr:50S ribosomal protein L21 [Alphaproteobacteria bacterium]